MTERLHPTSFQVVNFDARSFESHRYVLWAGACSPTHLLIFADSLESAMEEMCDWCVDNAPGYLCDDAVQEEYDRAIAEGKSEEEAMEEAEVDVTCFSHSGMHYIPSDEWGIDCEDPTRAQLHEIIDNVTGVYPARKLAKAG